MIVTTRRVICQQCERGRDAAPAHTAVHVGHWHTTRHGHEVWCRGWVPKVDRAFSYGINR